VKSSLSESTALISPVSAGVLALASNYSISGLASKIYEARMVSVTRTGQPTTLATLISERCRDLGLSQAEFVSRVGCRNIAKGILLLHQLFDGDHVRTKVLIEAISSALDLPDNVVSRAVQVSQQLLDDRGRRHFEIELAMRRTGKDADSVVPYLRLISG
jgi:hypothetical protein